MHSPFPKLHFPLPCTGRSGAACWRGRGPLVPGGAPVYPWSPGGGVSLSTASTENNGPEKKSVPSLQAQLRVWKEPSKVKAEASPAESREARGRGEEQGAWILRDPSGCPRLAGGPLLPHPKGKLSRTGSLLLVTRGSRLKAPSLRGRQLPRPL